MVSKDKKRLHISLSKEMIEELSDKQKKEGYSKSIIVERALKEYFRKGKRVTV